MAPPTLDELLQESRRKQNLENLAQRILGSRSRTPNASIANRSGVNKRPASVPRTNSASATRASRPAPQGLSGPPRSNRPREVHAYEYYEALDEARAGLPPPPQPPAPASSHPRNALDQARAGLLPPLQRPALTNGRAKNTARPAAGRPVPDVFSVRGAAKGEQYIVLAENFAPGTTAADIEAVMLDVGGKMHSCRLVNIDPVIAEMNFVNRDGGQVVIETFDGKKADGDTLHVYWKGQRTTPPAQRSLSPVGFVVDAEPSSILDPEDSMDVDEHTRDREEQNRLREERRGAAPRGPANEPQRDSRDHGGRGGGRGGRGGGYPSGPRADRGGYDGGYNEHRYGSGGGYGNGYGRRDYGGRGYSGY